MKSVFTYLLLSCLTWLNAQAQFWAFDSAAGKDRPAAYIYAPDRGRSIPNPGTSRLEEEFELSKVTGSFTLEGYIKPDNIPSRSTPVFVCRSEKDEELWVGFRWLRNFKQCYWGGSLRIEKNARPVDFSTGHYVSISRLLERNRTWRHLALVYSAEESTVTVWLDHWQSIQQKLEQPFSGTTLSLTINSVFEGSIDSVRLTPRALGPENFLRAVDTPLENVSFSHPDKVFPADAGHRSVKRHFGAVGDGKTDDTAAVQRAMECLDSHQASGKGSYVLYFPAGTYLVSDTVKWDRFLRVQGESKENTIIRLKDKSTGFGNAESPKPVVAASAVKGPPGSNKNVNGSTIANWFHDFTVETGSGNPGAVGIEYHSNNYGSLEQVKIRSGDGSGVAGLDLSHKTNGPTLIANTRIEGFDTGIITKYMEYSITMENVILVNQNEVGISNSSNILALRNIYSKNTVPALRCKNGMGMVTLLDSEFLGGATAASAIESSGALYARNVKVEGYGKTVAKQIATWNPHRKPNSKIEPGEDVVGNIEEYISDNAIHPEGKTVSALNLPIEATPSVAVGDMKTDWVNVQDFSNLVVGTKKETDWSKAIEAAFATGKPTVYFPRGKYPVISPVTVPASVKRLYGMDNGLSEHGLADKLNPNYQDKPAKVYITEDTDDPLLFDFFSASLIEHSSKRPVVLKHARFNYRGKPGAGNVYLHDINSSWFSLASGQNLWARQWNLESHAVDGPCLLVDNANLWTLGFKTEYESQKLLATNRSAIEIYGSFIYPVVKGIPNDRPVFELHDSRMAAQWGLSVYTARHFLQVKDVKAGKVRETTLRDGNQLGPRFRFDFYSNQ